VRDLPTIISNAVAIVTACYLLINVAYLSVMTQDKIVNTSAIAVDFGSSAAGLFHSSSWLGLALACGVALSTTVRFNNIDTTNYILSHQQHSHNPQLLLITHDNTIKSQH
jgi:amino acid transporter